MMHPWCIASRRFKICPLLVLITDHSVEAASAAVSVVVLSLLTEQKRMYMVPLNQQGMASPEQARSSVHVVILNLIIIASCMSMMTGCVFFFLK